MKKIYDSKLKFISKDAPAELTEWMRSLGYSIAYSSSAPQITSSIAAHPDLQMCRLGCRDDAPVCIASEEERAQLGPKYPADISFNAACTGKYFIHNLKHTNPELLEAARTAGMLLIDVPQGYAKCSTVIVDENSIITYDRGIAAACAAATAAADSGAQTSAYASSGRAVPGAQASAAADSDLCRPSAPLEVLLIEPGHVELADFSTGFIGGASGRLGDTIIFCGDIAEHPDGERILDFIGKRGLRVKCFGHKLKDIGSII